MKVSVKEVFVGSNHGPWGTSVRKDLWERNSDDQREGVSCGNTEKIMKSYPDSYDEDEDGRDVLQEHQNLVKQMKTEIKNSRTGGLPTISEECETPKMLFDDFKPMMDIHLNIEYKDVMAEIHKFHKRYTERMRKLDILNYQTLHAISFLHLKDFEIFGANKKKKNGDSSPQFTLPRCLKCKSQRIYDDPLHKKPIFDMHHDMELVYVGQICLSWEMLIWLTAKARQLMDCDPPPQEKKKNKRSYNRTAEGFQHFQVMLQRFLEDEQFQDHRIQNYVYSKCTIGSLLYVPDIKDDCSEAKKEKSDSSTDRISLEQLLRILMESKIIFRDFVYGDKMSKNSVLGRTMSNNLHEVADNSKLQQDILTDLQKKEKRLRDHIRSEDWFVTRLKKHGEQDRCLDDQRLTCEVELRLVARVLKLSRLTRDQLLWCRNKLNNINFVGRKVIVETAFALFPC